MSELALILIVFILLLLLIYSIIYRHSLYINDKRPELATILCSLLLASLILITLYYITNSELKVVYRILSCIFLILIVSYLIYLYYYEPKNNIFSNFYKRTFLLSASDFNS